MAGRSWGKTRTGAETLAQRVRDGRAARIALVAKDAKDARDVMIEGRSGILNVGLPNERPRYEPSKSRVTWPNGAQATIYSSEDPEELRGPEHDFFWADELAKWKKLRDTWDNLMMGLRVGDHPSGIVTTTPKPLPLVKELLAREGKDVFVTRGTTYENRENLPEKYFADIIERYEGTRLGRQELNAEVLEDVEGALWKQALIDDLRVEAAPELSRVIVGVDPAVTANDESDETGIVVAGKGVDKHYYVLADHSVPRAAPGVWAARAVNAYHDHKANLIVAEANNGGLMVRSVIEQADPTVPVVLVHASRGKLTRAEPVSMLYEQKRAHHVGTLTALEDQLTTYVPGASESPDRMDALVWAITSLMGGFGGA